ncbi:MAG: hypothetical protein ACK55I_01095, partial [bacterium]
LSEGTPPAGVGVPGRGRQLIPVSSVCQASSPPGGRRRTGGKGWVHRGGDKKAPDLADAFWKV